MIYYNLIAIAVFSFLLGAGVYSHSWFFTTTAVIAIVFSALDILKQAGAV